MYLKTLTVRGFKSFASATTFEFEPGVTAVVGPNGSGKSNVVDALAWVMGEQGAKTLRGGKMEDVIFAGTSARPALGRAQVSLTIDNADGALPIEYSEVTISRTLFRSGGSEYAINGSPCRLLDIQELLSDSGLGREMHVIVGQGQLDRILRATPEERRGFIEEAAGILKHRRRKEKTLRKLDSMQANLARLEDLTQEIARQLKPLGRQAATARRARTIQATVRDARARLLADELVALTEDARRAETAQAELRRAHEQAEQVAEEAATSVSKLEAKAAAASPLTVAARTTWYDLSRLQERYRSLITLAAERRRLLGSPDQTQARGEDPERLERRADQAAAEAAEAESGVAAAGEALTEAQQARTVAEAAQRAEDERLTRTLRAVADRREGLARLAGQVGTARQRVESAEGERARAAETGAHARERHDTAVKDLVGAERAAEEASEAARAPLAAVTEAREAAKRAREELREARSVLGPLSETRAALAARVETLGESVLSEVGAEELLEGRQDRLAGVLGERLRVRSGYERAVQSALAGAERALLAADAELSLEVAAAAAAGTPGAVWLLTRDGGAASSLPAGLRPLTDVIEANAEDLELVTALTSGVAIAEDDAEARDIAHQRGLTAVTPAGHRWDPTGVRIGSGDAAVLTRRARLEAAEAELDAARTDEHAAADRLAEAELSAERAEKALKQAETEARERSEASRVASAEVSRLTSLAAQAQQEAERMARAEADAANAVERASSALADLAERLETAQAVPEESEPSTADRDRLAEEATAARAAEVEARLALRAVEEAARRLRERERSLRRAAETERRARAEAERRARHRAAQAARAAEVQRIAERVAVELDASTGRAEEAVRAAEETERRLAAETEAARAVQAKAAAEVNRLAEAAHADDLAEAERRGRLENLAERSVEELGMTPEYLTEHFGPHLPVPVEDEAADKWAALRAEVDEQGNPVSGTPFVREEQERRLKRAEKDLAALGKVNPLALEEFAALEERHTYLTGQLEDLRHSRQDLLELVRQVDEHVRVVFAQAYEDTAREFVRIFDRLFPGGEGRLRLTDPDDMLATGIEVEARPAGKKVKRLSLLSGGERSLTAIAMLVAIFTARPSPFYVMDEVEAALDERNLRRLLTVFSDLREHSQLIIITHQKLTMDIADALYGVSMRGDGVTKVVSQRMEHDIV